MSLRPGSQTSRVLDALRARGEQGLSPIDFLPPRVCDGGDPITRVAACVGRLRRRGYVVPNLNPVDQVAHYVLVRAPRTSPARPGHATNEQGVLPS